LDLLFKHKGLLVEKTESTVTVTIEQRLTAGRDRLAKRK
jgi:hypothetical protein